jgi:hypothetical protein
MLIFVPAGKQQEQPQVSLGHVPSQVVPEHVGLGQVVPEQVPSEVSQP